MDVTHPVDPATIFDDKRAYLEAYQARKRDVIATSGGAGSGPRVDLLAELQDWWHPLLEQADMICAGINQPVLLDCEDEQLVIDFEQRVVRRPIEDENPRYQFAIPRELVDHLVHEHVDDWVNELFLSMRFTRPAARARTTTTSTPGSSASTGRAAAVRRRASTRSTGRPRARSSWPATTSSAAART